MSINEIKAKVTELKELKAMQEELTNEINAIEDELKAAMGEQEQLVAGGYKITWKTVTTSRLDSAALKKALPEIAAKFMKQTTSKRFCIN